MNEAFDSFSEGAVKGFLHTPGSGNGRGLILTHGASGNAKAPILVKIASEFASNGWTVLRFDLPYRQKRPSGPPHPSSAALDRSNILEAATLMRGIAGGIVLMSGLSYGGRQTSMLAGEHPEAGDGLVLFSYPLHPPGRSDLRTGHFPSLRTPVLFVHGTRDPFGSIDEMQAAIQLIPAAKILSAIDGAGHDLKRGQFDLQSKVLEPLETLL